MKFRQRNPREAIWRAPAGRYCYRGSLFPSGHAASESVTNIERQSANTNWETEPGRLIDIEDQKLVVLTVKSGSLIGHPTSRIEIQRLHALSTNAKRRLLRSPLAPRGCIQRASVTHTSAGISFMVLELCRVPDKGPGIFNMGDRPCG